MLSHDVRHALHEKADNWKVQDLKNEIHSLQDKIRDLTGTVKRLSNDNSGLREVLLRLIDLLSEKEEDEMFNQLQSLWMLL
jgi:archaellum component FlaC